MKKNYISKLSIEECRARLLEVIDKDNIGSVGVVILHKIGYGYTTGWVKDDNSFALMASWGYGDKSWKSRGFWGQLTKSANETQITGQFKPSMNLFVISVGLCVILFMLAARFFFNVNNLIALILTFILATCAVVVQYYLFKKDLKRIESLLISTLNLEEVVQ